MKHLNASWVADSIAEDQARPDTIRSDGPGRSAGRLHPLDQEVEVGASHDGILGGKQRQ